MKIGVIVAMSKELAQLRTLLEEIHTVHAGGRDFFCGKLAGHEIVLQQCGIGKVNSAVGAVEMIHAFAPEVILSSGCAGGASTEMHVGDIVIGTETVYHDAYCGPEAEFGQVMGMPARYAADGRLLEKARSLNYGVPVHAGLIAGGDWFVNSKGKMGKILDRFPEAKAVDMESCSIAQACHLYGVPFLSFRIVSDVPLKDTEASQYYDFWDRLADSSFHVMKVFLENIDI